MKLDALRTQALHHLAAGDAVRALRVYAHILLRLPADLDARMRVADIFTNLRQLDAARQAYAAVAYLDMQGGRPLHALVAMQALADLGEEVSPLRQALATLYGAGSPRVAKVGARLAPPSPDTEIEPLPPEGTLDGRSVLVAAASVAAETRTVREFPPSFQPVPLLSELSERAFLRLLGSASVHRLGHGATLIRKGEFGDAFYLIASGTVRVYTPEARDGAQVELARLSEGAIFGEMALIRAEPRSASVDVVGSADVIRFGRDAMQAAAGELPAVAAALDRFTRDRLLKNLLATSPLFRPFDTAQRVDLLRRFTGHEVEAGTDIVVCGDEGHGLYLMLSGQAEVLSGEPPFEQVVARLGPGECFGEISLLRRQPAMATVRAARRSSVLFLAREYFERLVAALPEMRAFFEALSEERLRRTQAFAEVQALSGRGMGAGDLAEDDVEGPLF